MATGEAKMRASESGKGAYNVPRITVHWLGGHGCICFHHWSPGAVYPGPGAWSTPPWRFPMTAVQQQAHSSHPGWGLEWTSSRPSLGDPGPHCSIPHKQPVQ